LIEAPNRVTENARGIDHDARGISSSSCDSRSRTRTPQSTAFR
jgi:hypothetical protein